MLETKVFKVHPYLENSHSLAPFQKNAIRPPFKFQWHETKEWLIGGNEAVYGLQSFTKRTDKPLYADAIPIVII